MNNRKHQSKLAILAESISALRTIIWPIIFIFFRGGNSWYIQGLIVVGLLVLSVILGLLNWWFFTYQITPHEISLTRGILVKKQAHIPFERVQTITRTQPIYFQPFHVFKVSIETSGKNDDKLLFNALALNEIENIESLRKQAQTKRHEEQVVNDQEPKIDAQYQINNRELCVYALTSLGSLGTIGVAVAILTNINDLLPNNFQNQFNHWINSQTVASYAMLIAIAVFVGFIGAFLRLYNRYFQFTIKRTAAQLFLSRGLLTKQNVQLRMSRIQAVHYEQSLLRRLVGLMSVSVLLASSVSNEEVDKQTSIMPVVKEDETDSVLKQFLPDYQFGRPQKAPLVEKAMFYQLRYVFFIDCAIIAFVSVVYTLFKTLTHIQMPYDLAIMSGVFFVLLVYSLASAYVKIAMQAISVDENYMIIQIAIGFTKNIYFIPREKIQSFSTTQTIFMVNKNGQHFNVIIRDGDGRRQVSLRYLDQTALDKITNWLVDVK